MSLKALRSAARRGLERGGSSDPRLLVRAMRLAAGVEQGRHGTAHRGDSTEFYDYRPYEEGDALASVDWRLFGRTDRHYVRRFRHDARLTITLAMDASASMEFRGLPGAREGLSKLELGVEVGAATLALGARQGDRVGLVVIDGGRVPVRVIPPAPGRTGLVRAVGALGVTRAGEAGVRAGDAADAPGSLARALTTVLDTGDAASRRGVIVLVGDGFEPVEPLGRALALASARGATVVIVRTLTPDELAPPGGSVRVYVDPETGVRVRAGAGVRSALEAHASALHAVAMRTGSRVVTARTDGDVSSVLREAFVPGRV